MKSKLYIRIVLALLCLTVWLAAADTDKLSDEQREQMLYEYALQNNLQASQDEVTDYFINQLGSHPKFATNGVFDYDKFNALRYTPEVERIWAMMERELSVQKARLVVNSHVNVNQNELLDYYIRNNMQVDLGYALIDEEAAVLPTGCSVQGGYDYAREYKDEFLPPECLRAEFVMLNQQDFVWQDQFTEQQLRQAYNSLYTAQGYPLVKALGDSLVADTTRVVYFGQATNVLVNHLRAQRARQRVLARAQQLASWWQNTQLPDSISVYTTPYITKADTLGTLLPANTLNALWQAEPGQVLDPSSQGDYWFVFKLQARTRMGRVEPAKIWQAYLSWARTNRQLNHKLAYFSSKIDSLQVPAAFVTSISINNTELQERTGLDNNDLVLESIKRNINNTDMLKTIAQNYQLGLSSRLLYLKRWLPQDSLGIALADTLIADPNRPRGIINKGDVTMVWRLDSYYPSFLPSFKDIEQYLPNPQAQADTLGHYRYWKEHRYDFERPDSLKLGGAFIKASTDFIDVSQTEIERYYQQHRDEFYRTNSVSFDYIRLDNDTTPMRDFALQLQHQLEAGADFGLLRSLYSHNGFLPANQPVEYDSLPEPVANALNNCEINGYTRPVYYNNACWLFKKLAVQQAEVAPLAQCASFINATIKKQRAMDVAYIEARAMFDTLATFNQLADSLYNDIRFETEWQSIEGNFGQLGSIYRNRHRYLQTATGKKVSQVVPADSGVAVAFVLKKRTFSDLPVEDTPDPKRTYRQLSYQEAAPLIAQKLDAQTQDQRTREFVQELADRLTRGDDPNRVFHFLGGWYVVRKASLAKPVPDLPYSDHIIEDAAKREVGEISRPIKIGNRYLIYRVLAKKTPSKQEFNGSKSDLKQELLNKKTDQWLLRYRAGLPTGG